MPIRSIAHHLSSHRSDTVSAFLAEPTADEIGQEN